MSNLLQFTDMMDFFRAVPKKRKLKVSGKGVLFYNPPLWRKTIFYAGNFVFLAFWGFIIYLYYPVGSEFLKLKEYQKTADVASEERKFGNIGSTQAIEIEEFELDIPAINAKAEVVKNVNPFEKSQYLKVLEDNKVAQAKGSGLPGEGKGKSIFIFAHSTQQDIGTARKNAIFYLLGELKNDNLVFIKYNGKLYQYRVYQQKIVAAADIDYIKYSEADAEVVILQTCWPIGTNWKRLLVFAKKI